MQVTLADSAGRRFRKSLLSRKSVKTRFKEGVELQLDAWSPSSGEVAMRALETLAIYVTPFLILGLVAKLLLQRYVVDLTDVQAEAGPKRRPRKVFLLGSWRTEK